MATKAEVVPGFDLDKFKALSHPIRFHALHVLSCQIASPTEVSRELGLEVNKVAYHIRILAKYNCIELVRTEPRRGATEHFYRATGRAVLTDEEWAQIPLSFKDEIVTEQTRQTFKAITQSMAAGAFNARNDRRQSWIPMAVDDTGWSEAMAVLAEAEAELLKIQTACAKRLSEEGGEGVPLAVSLMGFERAAATP